jgi:WD40 repeat protein
VFDEQGRSRATLAAGTLASGQLHTASFLPGSSPVLVTGSVGKGVREWTLLPAGQIPLAGIRGGVSSTLPLAGAGYVITTSGSEIYRIQPSHPQPTEVQGSRLKGEGIIDAASVGQRGEQAVFLTEVGSAGKEFRVHTWQLGDLRESAVCSLPQAWGPARQIACGAREDAVWVLCEKGLYQIGLGEKGLGLHDEPLTAMGGWTLAVGPRGETPFAALGDSNGVRLWWPNGEQVLDHPVSAMCVSPGEKYLAMAGGTKRAELGHCTIYTLKANTKEPIKGPSFTDHTGLVTCIAFSEDNRWLATGGADGLICLRSMDPGTSLAYVRRLRGHDGTVRSLAFSPDGEELLSGDDQGVALRWPLTDKALLERTKQLLEGK